MATTELFIEQLVTGIQATAWITLLVLSILRVDPANLLQIKDQNVIVLLLGLAIAYPLGVMLDNLSDRILSPLEDRIAKRIMGNTSFTIMEMEIRTKNERLLDYFEYVRRRIRITRTAIFNFPLIAVATIAFTISNPSLFPDLFMPTIIVEATVGTLATVLALMNWIDLSQKFRRQIVRAHKIIAAATLTEDQHEVKA